MGFVVPASRARPVFAMMYSGFSRSSSEPSNSATCSECRMDSSDSASMTASDEAIPLYLFHSKRRYRPLSDRTITVKTTAAMRVFPAFFISAEERLFDSSVWALIRKLLLPVGLFQEIVVLRSASCDEGSPERSFIRSLCTAWKCCRSVSLRTASPLFAPLPSFP